MSRADRTVRVVRNQVNHQHKSVMGKAVPVQAFQIAAQDSNASKMSVQQLLKALFHPILVLRTKTAMALATMDRCSSETLATLQPILNVHLPHLSVEWDTVSWERVLEEYSAQAIKPASMENV